MPNWCENRLEIIGSKKQLEKNFNIIKKDNEKELESLNLSSFISIPKNAPKGYNVIDKSIQKLNDSYLNWYSQNWYNYNVDFYGTKWIENINLFLVGDIENYDENIYHIHFSFETAWSSLNEMFLRKFSKKFNVSLILGFVESGVGFIGGGIIHQNKHHELDKDIDFEFNDNDEEENWEKFLDWTSDELESIYYDLKKSINFDL